MLSRQMQHLYSFVQVLKKLDGCVLYKFKTDILRICNLDHSTLLEIYSVCKPIIVEYINTASL